MIDEWMVEHIEHRPHPIVRAGDGRIVAEVQHEKDADLIAAAPELLEALETLLEYEDDTYRGINDRGCWPAGSVCDFDIARAATSRAKGQLQAKKEDLPGRPAVGWHAGKSGECANDDPCLHAMVSRFDSDDGETNAFAVIGARGPGRITRTKGTAK